VSAVAVNNTATGATTPGYLTVHPNGTPQRPPPPNLNYQAGQPTSNAAIVKPGTSGRVKIYAERQIDVIIDVTGYHGATGPAGGESYRQRQKPTITSTLDGPRPRRRSSRRRT
jgi:hypothetical protein